MTQEETCFRLTACFRLTEEELAHYDGKSRRMLVEPGEYEIMAGAFLTDIRCSVRIEIG